MGSKVKEVRLTFVNGITGPSYKLAYDTANTGGHNENLLYISMYKVKMDEVSSNAYLNTTFKNKINKDPFYAVVSLEDNSKYIYEMKVKSYEETLSTDHNDLYEELHLGNCKPGCKLA
jgi:hypothetical protein